MAKNNLVSVVIVTKDRKKELIECIDSCYQSSYSPLEIIVVDNGSKVSLKTWLLKKFPKIKLVALDKNIGAAGGRNRGLQEAEGDYVLFVDDDATIDKKMISELLHVFHTEKNAGVVQPIIYDKKNPKRLQGAGHAINLTTGRIIAWGAGEYDHEQYKGLRKVPMCGCVWMVKRKVFETIGTFDNDYFIPYEDSDFCLRAQKAGFDLYCYAEAKSWHPPHKITFLNPQLEWLGITSGERAYRTARNKIIFMRKHSPFPNNLIFFFIFFPIMTILHTSIILSTRRFYILSRYWSGVFSGLWYAIFYPFRMIKNIPLKILLLAWTDPLPWIIDKSARTILDLACGEGKPMLMIKAWMQIDYAVGVDLFEPYIHYAKQRGIHDKYIKQDIRKVQFPSRSFDIVLASHVIEHMPKKDAWQLIENMEQIAKKQVVIATPVGELYQPKVKGNHLEEHQSSFLPGEFEKRGYKIIRYGWRWLLDEHSSGLMHRISNPWLKKFFYLFNIMLTPIYYIFQNTCDYSFIAYKTITKEHA